MNFVFLDVKFQKFIEENKDKNYDYIAAELFGIRLDQVDCEKRIAAIAYDFGKQNKP